MTAQTYPARPAERPRWIQRRRGAKNSVRPEWPQAAFVEEEPTATGAIESVATILLTNRECPWRCLMCDLWRNTLDGPTPVRSIPQQIEQALDALAPCATLKLYNAGSFFDRAAIPREDWFRIAQLCAGFGRVIVECHPRLVGPAVAEFAEMLSGTLEVAMGLETAHPAALESLNKRFTLEDYKKAAEFLRRARISVRSFALVHPPFIERGFQQVWAERTIKFAFDAGSEVVSLIPLRHGNGAIDELAAEPELAELEEAQAAGIQLNRGRVFADLWDLKRFGRCPSCDEAHIRRIGRMNLFQRVEPPVECLHCGGGRAV